MRAVATLARKAVAFEISLYRSLFRWVRRRPDVPVGAEAFAYVGALSLVLWAFIVVSAIELVVLHLILPWETVRLIADVIGIWGLMWMLGLAASYHVYPHVVTDQGLRVRHGSGTEICVPWDAVAAVGGRMRSRDKSRALQLDRDAQGNVLNVVIASQTNVEVTLRRPITVPVSGQQEPVMQIRLGADDPRAMVRAARERLAGSDSSVHR